MRRVLGLLTDFGLKDPFVAEMKAVILSICEDAAIIDISHQVDKFDIKMGAFLLRRAAPYFPEGTIHVAVVDPGVGGKRRGIAVETERAVFVGPDNGLLIPAANQQNILHVYELTNTSLMRSEISNTFHGRDVFAPVSAHLAKGCSPKDCGPELKDYVDAAYTSAKVEDESVIGEVIHIDNFGNIITNIPRTLATKHVELGGNLALSVGSRRFTVRIVDSYSELREGELGAIFGSAGFLELACREKSAADKIRVNRGAVVGMRLD